MTEHKSPSPMDDLPAAIRNLTDELLIATNHEHRESISKQIETYVRLWTESAARPIPTRSNDFWDLSSIESALKEAESALASHDKVPAPACKCAWTVLDGERIRDSAVCNYCHIGYSFPVLTGIENGQGDPCCGKCFQSYGHGERHFCDPATLAAMHSFKKKACECRVMRAIDVIRSELDAATLTNFGWERLDDAPGYRHRCPEHKVTFKRVGSIDLCIKHRFRGTAEQPGCPECAASGDGGFWIEPPDPRLLPIPDDETFEQWKRDWAGFAPPDLTEPYRTFLVTGITDPAPANDFDDTTEPSAPTKRSDEPVPAWLSSEASEATSKACGCFTASGVTLQCLACAKGGGR